MISTKVIRPAKGVQNKSVKLKDICSIDLSHKRYIEELEKDKMYGSIPYYMR